MKIDLTKCNHFLNSMRSCVIIVCLMSIHAYGALIPDRNPKMDTQIKKLIDQTTKAKHQKSALWRLEAIGEQAVPYIIRRMDDRRKLGIPMITLENRIADNKEKSGIPFEATRHYGTEQVVDALGAILSQITGQSFDIDYAGGGNHGRELSISKWQSWCKEKYPNVIDGCVSQKAIQNTK